MRELKKSRFELQKMGLHLTKNEESFVFTQGNIQILDSTFSKKLLSMKSAKTELQ